MDFPVEKIRSSSSILVAASPKDFYTCQDSHKIVNIYSQIFQNSCLELYVYTIIIFYGICGI